MRQHGIDEATIQKIVWDNPVAFFAQSGRLDLGEIQERPVVSRSEKFESNSILRGEPVTSDR